ncbi:MAG: amino acid ABC transporter substrate-binding protein [Gammaproteobacteria bacterium]|nr:amino acid ABC transporter substrate-binding protein [Gammaproteobacteria bacterium]NIR84867.1 amino acid ABC transporter substrate-binding protein [Gammaproteobacteria bacterium]NIR91716.1 amino acid ABC transporter substrate-binding protein [Gammaproteobacteria bacterium]NIU05914.1 amino acid ABC transporter substrate-binding protein [Gammaproteobacteria bacterium]NIV52961.1 transporter substrate-binding domain-containing protein [Gammaproteobacteria bacterium]
MHRLLAHAALAAALVSTGVWADTLERIEKTGVFKLGFREDAPPFAYRNEIGEAEGYSVELCRAVAKQVARQLDLSQLSIDYVPVTAENRFEMVEKERVDILCGPTTHTLSRRAIVDFSLTTFIDGASVLFRKDGPSSFRALAGESIGVRAGTTTEDALRNTLSELDIDAEVVAVESHFDGLEQVQSGRISAYFADWGILLGLLQRSERPELLRLSPRQFTQEPYALGLARGDDDFRLLVDRTLSRLYRSGEIQTIFNKAFSPAEPTDLLKAVYIINRLPE